MKQLKIFYILNCNVGVEIPDAGFRSFVFISLINRSNE